MSDVFAFDAEPAQHLITGAGQLLDITQSDCTEATPCFMPHGVVTPFNGPFIAMHNRGSMLYAMVEPSGGPAFFGSNFRTLLLQSVDTTAHTRETQSAFSLELGQVVALDFDANSNRVVFARSMTDANGGMVSPSHRIELLPLQ